MKEKQNYDQIFEDKLKEIFELLKNEYFDSLKKNNQSWVTSYFLNKIKKNIEVLFVGYPGQIREINHYIKEILKGFKIYYYKQAINPKMSEYLPEIIKLRKTYIDNEYKTSIRSDFLIKSTKIDWVNLCAEFCAYNNFIEFIESENEKPSETESDINNNIVEESNTYRGYLINIENAVKECFMGDYWDVYKKQIEPKLLSFQATKKKKCLEQEINGRYVWKGKREMLVAIIMILTEYGYFQKSYVKKREHLILREAFEKYYNVNLQQYDTPKEKDKIDLNNYKRIFPFIVPPE